MSPHCVYSQLTYRSRTSLYVEALWASCTILYAYEDLSRQEEMKLGALAIGKTRGSTDSDTLIFAGKVFICVNIDMAA